MLISISSRASILALTACLLAASPGPQNVREEETLAPGLQHIVLRRGAPARERRFRVLVGSFESQAGADKLWNELDRAGIRVRAHYRGGRYLLSVDELTDLRKAEEAKRHVDRAHLTDEPAVVQDYEQDVTHAGGPWEIHVLEADPERVRVEVAHAYDAAIGLETTSGLSRRRGALAAVNGGYYLERGLLEGDAVGALAIDGVLFSEPDRGRGAVAFYEEDGLTRALFNRLAFRGELVLPDGTRVSLDGVDRRRGLDEVVLYGPEFHHSTLTGSQGTEVVVENAVVQAIRDGEGSTAIPAEGFVVSIGPGRKAVASALEVGERIELRTRLIPLLPGSTARWDSVPFVLGAGPLLLRQGSRLEDHDAENVSRVFFESRHPRTAAAVRRDGTLLFVTVDGRQPERSVGMSLPELTDLLLELGAHSAVNLDGGGSTTMVVKGRLANLPSDPLGERKNASAILLFPRQP